MFFFLLIIRDLVGVHNEVSLSRDFAIGSILFFLGQLRSPMLGVAPRKGPENLVLRPMGPIRMDEI